MDGNSVAMASENSNVMSGLVGVIIGFGMFAIVLIAILGIVWYVLQALGFYKMAKNRGIEPAWIAWIPVAQNYLFGELIGNEVWGFGYANWILVAIPIFSSIVSGVSDNLNSVVALILLIVILILYVYMMTALYKLYKTYSTKATIMLVFSIIFPFLSSIFIFAIRNNNPNYVIDNTNR